MKRQLIMCVVFCFLLLLIGCVADNKDLSSDSNCQVEDLMLGEADYPTGSTFDQFHSPIAEEPKESISQSVDYHGSWAGQMAIKYRSTSRAKQVFNRHKENIFSIDEYQDAWEKPPPLADMKDLLFENYEIACGTDKILGYRCYMIGQYHRYFVMFRVSNVSSSAITHEMFRDLVLKIDDRLSSCVSQ